MRMSTSNFLRAGRLAVRLPAVKKSGAKCPWWVWLLVASLAPLVTVNLAVAVCGRTVVFPLSPFYLRQKTHALAVYLKHRSVCVWSGHEPLDQLLAASERRHKLPRHLLEALVMVESGKQTHRISRTGAMGPAQLMPATAQDMQVVDPFDPEDNLNGGARYLAWLIKRYHKVPLALAAYNAGPGNVKGHVPKIGETQEYVRRVLLAYSDLREPAATRVAKR